MSNVQTTNHSLIALTICTVYLTACSSDGTPGEGQSDLLGGDVTSQQPDAALFSSADTSATTAAVRSGLNPETTLISSDFFCYSRVQSDVSSPATTLSVTGNSLTVGGLSANIIQGNAPGELILADSEGQTPVVLEFDEFGQSLSFGPDFDIAACYQEGASHDAALHQFSLNMPLPGRYSCNVSYGDVQPGIELLPGNSYRVNDLSGRYRSDGIVMDDFSEITFLDGPLAGSSGEYYSDPDSGEQTLSIIESSSQVFQNLTSSSMSTLQATCSNVGSPNPFKRYGPTEAPGVPAPAVPVDGLYVIDLSVLTATERDDSATFVQFWGGGNLRLGKPLPGGTDCRFTRPNGLPMCDSYLFDGQNLTINQYLGVLSDTGTVVFATDGSLSQIGGLSIERAFPVTPAAISGTWNSQQVSGLSNCVPGIFCDTSITERTVILRSDGQYLVNVSTDDSSFIDSGVLQVFSSGASSDQSSGTWQVSGNRIAFTQRSGVTIEDVVSLRADGRLVLGELQYSRQ